MAPENPLNNSIRLYQCEFAALKSCKHGAFLYNVNDAFIGRSLDLYGEWCEDELELLRQMIRPGSIVLDLGANIGTHTVFFAKQVAPKGMVLAFEPQRLAFHNLCANLALNAITNVVARQVAVGDITGSLRVPVLNPRRVHNFGRLSLTGQTEGEPVPLIRLDDLRLSRCDLIKIDVEGMETAVLNGARETLERCKPSLFVENDRVEKSAELITTLLSLDYVLYWHFANYYSPRNYFKEIKRNIFPKNSTQTNLLGVHRAVKANPHDLEPVTGPADIPERAMERLQQRLGQR